MAKLLRDDETLGELLPGGIWTRQIMPNSNPAGTDPTPGSTPDAFDHAGRIKRCAAVLYDDVSAVRNPVGPDSAYMGGVNIFLRCLPHETEKRKLHDAAERIIALCEGAVLTGTRGEGLVLSISARMMPTDDPNLPPAVVDMIRVQTDSVWRV
ncbi:hypothetical protein [Microbacterium sp.]|uniref:hypothetical protein n=1 Tax=Microbacterium sp. TaxID=51671 RepID=UPI00260E391E|nr:hypothetical protein [Microbacterium sp.]